MKDSKYPNIKQLGVHHRIVKSNSPVNVFFEQVLPIYISHQQFITSKPDPLTKLRPRELLGLSLLSILATQETGQKWVPTTDPLGRDGAIMRVGDSIDAELKNAGLIVEQVYVSTMNGLNIAKAIIDSLENKSAKGSNYAENMNLLILVDTDQYIVGKDLLPVLPHVYKTPYEACYIFIMQDPKPLCFLGATLRSFADPLHNYSIIFDPIEEKVTCNVIGRFEPKNS